MKDDADVEGLPAWYTDMEEFLLYVTHIHTGKLTQQTDYDFDYNWFVEDYDASVRSGQVDTWFANGEYEPTICLTAGTWTKFRMAQVETTELSAIYYFGEPDGSSSEVCELYLLARDGVMVHGTDNTVPRAVGNGVWLSQSSRADVAVHCPGNSNGADKEYSLWVVSQGSGGKQVFVATLLVSGAATPAPTLSEFQPNRPGYLEDLRDGVYSGNLPTQTFEFCEGNINSCQSKQTVDVLPLYVSGASLGYLGNSFNGYNYYMNMSINRINTWYLDNIGNNLHPFHIHIHINHVQLVENHLGEVNANAYDNWVDIPDGYQEVGDFFDTVWGISDDTAISDEHNHTQLFPAHNRRRLQRRHILQLHALSLSAVSLINRFREALALHIVYGVGLPAIQEPVSQTRQFQHPRVAAHGAAQEAAGNVSQDSKLNGDHHGVA